MAANRKPGRAEVRARRARAAAGTPTARVHVLVVVDPVAQRWESQVAFFADSPEAARARQERAGFFRRNSRPLPSAEAAAEEFGFATDTPSAMFLRRGHDFGWSRWYELPEDYEHPPQGTVARDVGAFLLPGEPVDAAEEFLSHRWSRSPLKGEADSSAAP